MLKKEMLYYMTAKFYEEGGNFLDALLPFMEYCLSKSLPDKITAYVLKNVVEKEMQFNFPIATYEAILHKMLERDILTRVENRDTKELVYYEPKKGFKQHNFETKQNEFRICVNAIAEAFSSYCTVAFNNTKLLSSAKNNVLEFVLKFIDDLLRPFSPSIFKEHDLTEDELAFALFLLHEYEKNTDTINYLNTIIKGAMCHQLIFYNEATPKTDLSNLIVFFDTTLIMYAMGYSGEIRKNLASELIHKLKSLNAKLYCFEHTVAEILRNLSVCENIILNRKSGYGQAKHTVEYFYSLGNSISAINIACTNLRENITAETGIEIFEETIYESDDKTRFIDEKSLAKRIIDDMRYTEDEEERAYTDAKSINQTTYLRKNKTTNDLSNAHSIFVTTNGFLAYISSKFLNEPETIIPTTFQHTKLSTLLTLSNNIEELDLPLAMIVEKCYAATCPPDNEWRKYIESLNNKLETGEICDRDYLRFRSMRYASQAKVTFFDTNIGALSIDEVIKFDKDQRDNEKEKVREEERLQAKKLIDKEAIKVKEISKELDRARTIIDNIESERKERIRKIFKYGKIATIIVLAFSSLLSYLSSNIIWGIILTAIAVFSLAISFFPLMKKIENSFIKRELRKINGPENVRQ